LRNWRRSGWNKNCRRADESHIAPLPKLAEIIHRKPAALDDAFERSNGYGLAPVHGNYDLASIGMPPFLVAAGLIRQNKSSPAQNFNYVFGASDWKPAAQGTESSSNLAPLSSFTGEGSNHRASASRAFATASASVSPAVAQPGSSGKTADHLLVEESNLTSRRNFMVET
jgi:hypothetical protein